MATLLLKKDLFGTIERVDGKDALTLWGQFQLPGNSPDVFIVRNTTVASRKARWLGRRLAFREAKLLRRLPASDQLPQLLAWRDGVLLRSWIEGQPMQEVQPRERAYFAEAHRLLRRIHRAGVVHNDLAKPNWLVMSDGRPALVDYQMAWAPGNRSPIFRMLGREDIRHLLKHKRSYVPELLTLRERRILAKPAIPSRLWTKTVKPVFLVVSRKFLGWHDSVSDRTFER